MRESFARMSCSDSVITLIFSNSWTLLRSSRPLLHTFVLLKLLTRECDTRITPSSKLDQAPQSSAISFATSRYSVLSTPVYPAVFSFQPRRVCCLAVLNLLGLPASREFLGTFVCTRSILLPPNQSTSKHVRSEHLYCQIPGTNKCLYQLFVPSFPPPMSRLVSKLVY